MIRLQLKSENTKADQLAKYYQTAFLSFNSNQKRALSEGTISATIKDNNIDASYRSYPILKTLIVELCKGIMSMDENEVWDTSVMEKRVVIFKTDKPVQHKKPKKEHGQSEFDPNQYTEMSVPAFKKSSADTFSKKELRAILKAEKTSDKKHKTFIAYLNKLISG